MKLPDKSMGTSAFSQSEISRVTLALMQQRESVKEMIRICYTFQGDCCSFAPVLRLSLLEKAETQNFRFPSSSLGETGHERSGLL
jgi:hypothetical protein